MSAATLDYLAIGRFESSFDGSKVVNSKLVLSAAAPKVSSGEKLVHENTCKAVLDRGAKLKIGEKIQLTKDDKISAVVAVAEYLDEYKDCTMVIFAVVTMKWLEARQSSELLREFKTQFLSANSAAQFKSASERDSSMESRSRAVVDALFRRYGDDILQKVKAQTDEVRDLARKNVDKALENLETTKAMEEKADGLLQQSEVYNKKATDLKMSMCKQYWKMNLAIALIVIVIIIIIVASICSGAGKCGKSD